MPRITQRDQTTDGVQAVYIAIKILELLAFGERPGRVTDLAEALGTSKNRVYRHLQTLLGLGYVVKDADTDQYRLGIRLVQLGSAVANQYDLLSVSRPIMRRLRDSLGHTIVLSKVDADRIYAIERIDGRSNMTIGIVIGTPLGLNSSAQGKIVLAFGREGLLDEVVAADLDKITPHTIVDPERLRAEIAAVRNQGWATAPSETLTGLNALAVPIFDGAGELFATIGALASVDALPPRPDATVVEELKQAARAVSSALHGGALGESVPPPQAASGA